MREITAAAKMHGKHAGFVAMDDAGARQALAQGFRLVAFGVDFQLYQRALRAGLDAARAAASDVA